MKNDLPLLEYCTLPRTGALEIIMQVIGPKTDTSKHDSNAAKHKEALFEHTYSSANNDGIPDDDTREVVTNNNQIKWNTARYFRWYMIVETFEKSIIFLTTFDVL